MALLHKEKARSYIRLYQVHWPAQNTLIFVCVSCGRHPSVWT